MKKILLVTIFALITTQAFARNGGWYQDILTVPGSTTLPTACTDNQIYVDTNATSGQRMYLCEDGSWVQQGGSFAGTMTADLELGNTPYSIDGGSGGLAFDPDNDGTNETTINTDGDVVVPDEAYDATAWNGSLEVPTKNALRDKIETISAGSGGTSVNTTPIPDVVYITEPTHDFAIGGTTSAAPIFCDESNETCSFAGGILVGANTSGDITAITITRSTGNQTIAWDDTNNEFDFSAPINASGTGPSSISQGLTVNDGGGGTTDDDFVVESDSNIAILKVDASADAILAGDTTGTNYTSISTTGAISQSGSATLTLQDGSDLIITSNANAAPFLANSGDTGTGVFDFGGATSLETVNGTGPTVDATGEFAVDTTDDQLVYYGGSAKRVLPYERTICFDIESLASTDDNYAFFMANDAITVTGVGCNCRGTCSTLATFTLEDRGGNAMTITGTNPTCATTGAATFAAVTAGNQLTAGEMLAFDVTNSPTTGDTYALCATITTDAQ